MEFPDEVNEIIRVYNACQDSHTLPRSGGYLDQDAYMMELFAVVRNEINQFNEVQTALAKARQESAKIEEEVRTLSRHG